MQIFGPLELIQRIRDANLCTSCGACADMCPYLRSHNGSVIQVFACDRSQGRCYAHCPHIGVDRDELSRHCFKEPQPQSPLGSCLSILSARRGKKAPDGQFQNGGTVSSLVIQALRLGLIHGALLTDRHGLTPAPLITDTEAGILHCASSKYMATPTLAALNAAMDGPLGKLAVVGTPCQMTALAQLRMNPLQKTGFRDITSLRIGLFCTWAVDAARFARYMAAKGVDTQSIRSMDIPPPPAETFVLNLTDSVMTFPLDDLRRLVPGGCAICPDMTGEFTDLSVGALEGRTGWNTLIVRTPLGQRLVDQAVINGMLEVEPFAQACLDGLSKAAANKRQRASDKAQTLGMTSKAFQEPALKQEKQTIMGLR
ncbi:MAG: Coenzyme F420 hydrogenase/dehydrogenase, beta subunit C-terminal domain [Pseudomonadota bacterium]